MVRVTNIIKLMSFLILLLPLALLSAPDLSSQDETIKKIIPSLEKKITQTMKANGIPGVAVAIVSRDKVHYLKTFGVKRLGTKDQILPTTVFQIASLSKPVNATMMAILEDKGTLSLEDPVERFLPHFHLRKRLSTLKVCHLLSHSSGVPKQGFDGLIEAHIPRYKIIDKLQRAFPVAAPGKRFAYNNAMYGVVEDVITRAAGKPLEQALQEELFRPLGMRHACVGLHALLNVKDRAYPHVPNGRGKYMPAQQYSKAYYAFPTAGGVNASIQDLIPFLQLYLGKPSPIVSSQTLKKLTNPFVKNNRAVLVHEAKKGVISNTYYGFGWHSMTFANEKIIYHQGHLKGFRNFMGFIQDDVGIIILTNAEKKHASKFALKFFDLYLNS
ncbi:MAG: serine hydrolase domain-containing protein [Candidatus Berkiellales bacterium]